MITRIGAANYRYELRFQIDDAHQLLAKNESLFVFPMSEAYEAARLPLKVQYEAAPELPAGRWLLGQLLTSKRPERTPKRRSCQLPRLDSLIRMTAMGERASNASTPEQS
jgi:hypothetical protein